VSERVSVVILPDHRDGIVDCDIMFVALVHLHDFVL